MLASAPPLASCEFRLGRRQRWRRRRHLKGFGYFYMFCVIIIRVLRGHAPVWDRAAAPPFPIIILYIHVCLYTVVHPLKGGSYVGFVNEFMEWLRPFLVHMLKYRRPNGRRPGTFTFSLARMTPRVLTDL